MEDVTEIYVVTHGEYEEYRIAAVFTDKPLAEQFAEALDDFGKVETYRVRTAMPKKTRLYHVVVDATGTVIYSHHKDHWDFEEIPKEFAGLHPSGSGAWAEDCRSHKAAVEMARAKLNEARIGKKGA